jgi:hypothetical protein
MIGMAIGDYDVPMIFGVHDNVQGDPGHRDSKAVLDVTFKSLPNGFKCNHEHQHAISVHSYHPL